MTRRLLAVMSSALLLPTTCFAVLFSTKGNEPIPAQNYTAWPGLVDVVNDESRIWHMWCNGAEAMTYRGDTAALNRVVKEFAEVQAEERRIVLLPGPQHLYVAKSKANKTGAVASDDEADWKLNFAQGFDRADPTLTIYVTNRIDLESLQIPEGITVLETAGLRERYASSVLDGSERARREIDILDAAAPNEGDAAAEFRSRLAAIQEFVRQRK